MIFVVQCTGGVNQQNFACNLISRISWSGTDQNILHNKRRFLKENGQEQKGHHFHMIFLYLHASNHLAILKSGPLFAVLMMYFGYIC